MPGPSLPILHGASSQTSEFALSSSIGILVDSVHPCMGTLPANPDILAGTSNDGTESSFAPFMRWTISRSEEMAQPELEVKNWLMLWASDNLPEGYTDSAESLQQAATDCLTAAEDEGVSTELVLAAANGDLVAWLHNLKEERLDEE
jgi:hypothetical protein